VVTAGLDRGPLAIEGSLFRGREPDEHRYDLEFAALDSLSARIWFRPSKESNVRGFHVGVGADLVFYDVPSLLQFTHGDQPVTCSFVFGHRRAEAACGT
jgi:hypothetical protein